jgi:peptide/nickel transport system permease protein
MARYLLKRFLTMPGLFLALSVAVFIIIQLPPGDYMTAHVGNLENNGYVVNADMLERIKK